MKASLNKLDLTYEALFSAPAFDLPARNTTLLKALYENFHPEVHIESNDMHVVGGSKLSEVRVGVTLSGGRVRIDVAADKFSLEFSGLQSSADIGMCKSCIQWSEQAVKSVLPDIVFEIILIRPLLFFELDGGVGSSKEHLAQVAGYLAQFDLSGFSGADLQPKIDINVENTEENWFAMMNAWPTVGQSATLNVSCFVRYSAGGTIHGLDNQANHIQNLIEMFLSGIGLEITDSNWSNR